MNTSRRRWIAPALYILVMGVAAAVTAGVLALLGNIEERKREAEKYYFELVALEEDTVDPAVWGRNFPRQYDAYRRTVDTERTRHGGSDAFQKLDEDPVWRTLFAGYAFGVDYREERGHAFMLQDQEETLRVRDFAQPGACLHCHASVLKAYRDQGRAAGIPDDRPREQMMEGFARVCPMPYAEARKLVEHPISCVDCHDPKTMQIRVTRPGFMEGIARLAASDAPTPHLPSITRWRATDRKEPYDPNRDATRQEMRSFVCGQCHVEYYFKGPEKRLTYPWHKGLGVDPAEAYYDEVAFTDWTHAISGAPMLKAQHPEFEMWSHGIHARSGVACADCHMPYMREGAVKISDHHVRSPLLNVHRACLVCHAFTEEEMRARAEVIQDRNEKLMRRAEEAAVSLVRALEREMAAGVPPERLEAARKLHRRAQYRLDYVYAENSMGFHAPQEAARILAEAIDYARQGELLLMQTRM